MRILNYGSINIDHVYQVDHFVQPGETQAAIGYHQYCGGKGLNQSMALAAAGAEVYHAGRVGPDGVHICEQMKAKGVKTEFITIGDEPTGHALIQVTASGENCIITFGGANHLIDSIAIDQVLLHFEAGDFLLVQNEISAVPYLIEKAAKRGMKIIFNPAPLNRLALHTLEHVNYFIVNEVEGAGLTGASTPETILTTMAEKYPKAQTILTLGENGVSWLERNQIHHLPAVPVRVVDTTAAGDTFIGYFVTELVQGTSLQSSLEIASQAAALCVTRPGAAASIPSRAEVVNFVK